MAGHLQVDDGRSLSRRGNAEAEVVERGAQPFLEAKSAVEHPCRERTGWLAQRGQNQPGEQQQAADDCGRSWVECGTAHDVD
ncbi:MAG: hypothetical protein K0S78_5456 [Thermomicrobiales bacterium]|nr:hypothetical protein [Thermomicrobiales bacterium]